MRSPSFEKRKEKLTLTSFKRCSFIIIFLNSQLKVNQFIGHINLPSFILYLKQPLHILIGRFCVIFW